MNKSYVLIKFQHMPGENLARNQNAVGPQFSSYMWVWIAVQLHQEDSQPAIQYWPLEGKLWVCITGYTFGTQIL